MVHALRRLTAIAALALLFYLLLGNLRPPRGDSAREPLREASFAEQLAAVRAGKSPEIRLARAKVSDADLAQLAGLKGLERLNVPTGDFTDEGLAHLRDIPDLTLLRIGSPRVTDEGMRHIAALVGLRFLHLIDVPITDEGIEHLAAMTNLESFYLDGSRATDEGLSQLIQKLPRLHFHRDQLHLPGDPQADAQ